MLLSLPERHTFVNNKHFELVGQLAKKFSESDRQIADKIAETEHFLGPHSERDAYRFHLVRMLCKTLSDDQPNYHITLTNRCGHLSRAQIEHLVYGLKCRINKRRLGRDWHKCADQCLTGVAIFENASESNEHVHLVVQLPLDTSPEEFKAHIGTIWAQLADRGTCQIDPVYNGFGLFDYLAKEMRIDHNDWKKMEDVRPHQKG